MPPACAAVSQYSREECRSRSACADGRTDGSATVLCDGQRKRVVAITTWHAESITPVAAALERMAATKCLNLAELSLCFCALGDSGVELLAHALTHNRTLATVRSVRL